MRTDSCRKCGNTLEIEKQCNICNNAIEFVCNKCNMTTVEQIHLNCIAMSFDYHLLNASVT